MNNCPNNWGSDLWNVLHYITTKYDLRKKSEYKIFFYNVVPAILTCKKCSNNYKNHIRNYPIKLNSKNDLIIWLYNIHNQTNKTLDKPIYPLKLFINKIKNYDEFTKISSKSTTNYILYMQNYIRYSENIKIKIEFSNFLYFILNI